ncbi:MAG: BON domain-containing protein [Candidatus Eremiobacteraeota bacterium]|nr:BON domain-containing protein [Candidatus Eremiobacteraeota bacterium]
MGPRLTWGLVAAAALGLVAGYSIAPKPARSELRRRAVRNFTTLQGIAVRETGRAARAAAEVAGSAGRVASSALKKVTGPLAFNPPPTQKLKDAISEDAILARRPIWVDAVGDTMLLHGIVDNDEEWRSADLLARLASPDGSVRNLLQVRRQQSDS